MQYKEFGKRAFRIRTYFIRGHSQYLILLLSLSNFIVIQYELFVKNIVNITIFEFSLLFISIYPMIAIFLGILDYKKGSFRSDVDIYVENNPHWQDLMQKVNLIYEKQNSV